MKARFRLLHLLAISSSLAAVNLTGRAVAATSQYWNVGGAGGDGIWGTGPGDKNWNLTAGAAAGNTTWPDTADDVAVFQDALGGTVTVFDPVQTNGLSQTGANYTLDAGVITLVSDAIPTAPFINVQTGTLTVNSVLAGSAGLTKTGGGALVLSNANPLTGPVQIDAGILNLTGSLAATDVRIAAGAGLLDANGGLVPATNLTNAGTLTVNAADTIASYTSNGGTLTGTGALTTSSAFLNNGSVISGKLATGDLTTSGLVTLTGSATAASTTISPGTLRLTGALSSPTVDILAGSELQDNSGGLDTTTAITNSGSLSIGAPETIATYTQEAGGRLAGSNSLTVGSATLNGGTIIGHLNGNTTSTGNVLVTGIIGGGTLDVTGGLLTLNGISTNTTATIGPAAGVLIAKGQMDSRATLTNAGTLTVNTRAYINQYTQSVGGLLDGSANLDADDATLNGGTVAGNLYGAIVTTTGPVLVSGTLGGRILRIDSGTTTLAGTADFRVRTEIAATGTLLDTNGGLADSTVLTNSGTLTVNAADTVARYTQNGAGLLDGSASLTTTGGATLTGGTVAGKLRGDTTSTGHVLVSGTLGGGSLDVTGGTLTLTGSLSSPIVNIASGAWLKDYSGGLADTAAVTNGGLLIMGAADSVATYHSSGTLVGPEILYATSASLANGAGIFGNLQTTTLTTNDHVEIRGTVTADSTRIATGTLRLATELWGIVVPPGFVFDRPMSSAVSPGLLNSATVDIAGGATLSDLSGGLADTTILTNAGTLVMEGFINDRLTTYISNGGTLASRISLPSGVSYSDLSPPMAAPSLAGDEWTSVSPWHSISGPSLTAGTAALNDGSLVSGTLIATTLTANGLVSITGSATAASIDIVGGILTNTGTLTATNQFNIASDATLIANGTQTYNLLTTSGSGAGTWQGDLTNPDSIAPGGVGPIGTLAVTGNFNNASGGILRLDLGTGIRDLVTVGGTATFGGTLDLNQLSPITPFVPVQVVAAGSYAGNFTALTENLDGSAWFNPSDGTVTAMAAPPTTGGTLWGTTANQTSAWVALYDDVIAPGTTNITYSPAGGYQITGGIADAGNPDLLNALSASLVPGGLDAGLLNRLSPEVYASFQDYAIEATRAHQRAALDAPSLGFIQPPNRPDAKDAKHALPAAPAANAWEYFAALEYFDAGTDSSPNQADYDLSGFGFIAGARTSLSDTVRIGGYLAADDGTVEGALIDADACGWSLGLFAKALVHARTHTLITGGLSYGKYQFEGTRGSLIANGTGWTPASIGFSDVDSDALEFYLGASSLAYQTDRFRLIPSFGLRYVTGGMDGFAEAAGGPGSPIALVVGEDAYHSALAELSLRAEADLTAAITAHGVLGFRAAITDDPAALSARFATGSRPQRATAAGLDGDAFFVGLGATWRLRDDLALGLHWRADFRSDADPENNLSLSTSFRF